MKKAFKISTWVLLGVLALAIIGWVTQLLWNWLVPALFHGPTLDFWQALGLLALSKILLWGIGGRRHSHYGGYWKHRYYKKLSSMTPEEREAFKEKMMNKWCKRVPDTSESN